MNIDFALIMFIALVVTGMIWGLDRMIGAPARQKKIDALKGAGGSNEAIEKIGKEPVLVEYARAFFPVILIVFLLRSFIMEPFRIPSGSMLPGLLPGDFILVNKFSYGIRLPVINFKVTNTGDVKRGDVMVFRYPQNPSINYIKRVVGLAGDRISYRDKTLYINDVPMVQTKVDSIQFPEQGGGAGYYERYRENLAGLEHDILLTALDPDKSLEIEVPEGHYFVMGDNRDRSNDSRYWGYVPDENLVGKAFFIWFSWEQFDESGWFLDRIRWTRIGNSIN